MNRVGEIVDMPSCAAIEYVETAEQREKLLAAVTAVVAKFATVYGGNKTPKQVADVAHVWLETIQGIEFVTPSVVKQAMLSILETFEGFWPAPATFRKAVAIYADEARFKTRHAELNSSMPALERRNDERSIEEIRESVKAKIGLVEGEAAEESAA